MLILRLAARNIFRNRARSIITLGTITFGCVALIFVAGFFEDIFLKLREGFIRSQTGHIQVYRKGFNNEGKAEPFAYLIENPGPVKDVIAAIAQVKSIAARLSFSGLISSGETTISFVGQGVESRVERELPGNVIKDFRAYVKLPDAGLPVMMAGTTLSEGDSSEAVLGKGLAQTMEAKVGAPITLLTESVSGSVSAVDVNVKGIFFTATKDYDDITLRLPLATAQRLLRTKGVDRLVVQLQETAQTEQVAALLRQRFARDKMNLEIKTWNQMSDFYDKTVDLLNSFQRVMTIVIATVVVLGVFNTMNMAVIERTSEIGTILSLGTRRGGVVRLFLLEGLLLGAMGGAVGCVCGVIIVRLVGLKGIMMPPPPGGTIPWLSTPFVVPARVASTFALATFVGAVSSFIPAYKASRLQITTALRYR